MCRHVKIHYFIYITAKLVIEYQLSSAWLHGGRSGVESTGSDHHVIYYHH